MSDVEVSMEAVTICIEVIEVAHMFFTWVANAARVHALGKRLQDCGFWRSLAALLAAS